MLDDSLLFEDHTTKWTKTPQNVQSKERPKTIFSLVTTTVTSRLLYKIS